VADLRPDALVVSLSLPGRDGYEVGRSLRSRKELATIPLIGLKGMFESMDAERTVPSEYDEVVLKPFDSERLAAVVRELIARKTGPRSLPEDPVWPGEEGAAASRPGLKAIVREEIVGMEREIEKRVRASVLAELKEWMSRS
jgi:DNA-binding response OmpR family regulator